MTFLHALFSWANAPYTTALLVVAFYVLLQLIGLLPWGHHEAAADGGHDVEGGHDGGHEAHVDVGHEAHVDVGHEAHVDAGHEAHVDAGHEAHVDADHDAGHDADHDADHPSPAFSVLGALGVGKVPTTIVWQTLFTTFGLGGLACSSVTTAVTGSSRGWWLLLTLPLAALIAFFLTSALVRFVARLVPAASGKASTRQDLIGCAGVVISSKVTPEFGEVRLKDGHGRTIRMVCYTHAGEPPLAEGTEVVVTGWDRERDHLLVSSVSQFEKK